MAFVASRQSMTADAQLRARRTLGRALIQLVAPIVIIAVWWFASEYSTSPYFPPLSGIVTSFIAVWISPSFLTDAVPSLAHFAIGLAIATVVGVGGGLLLGLWRRIGDAVAPVLEFARATPAVALAPIAIVAFGIRPTTQVIIIASATVWPILLNATDGVRSIDPMLVDVARSYRLGRADRIFRVTLPAAGPQIMAGVNTAVAVGLVMIVFSEMQGATNGIGYTLLQQQRSYNISAMWGTIVFLGILGYLLNLGFRAVESVVLRWHQMMQRISSR
jgi:sulfonate transport system permease protein